MKLNYHLVNVFGREQLPFSGNPLCVVEPGETFSDADMQAIARQFNLSETVFLQPSEQADARVRIFTPESELPFAGHPTLGSAFMVARLAGRVGAEVNVRLQMRAGNIPVRIRGRRCTLRAGSPSTRALHCDVETLAKALRLPVASIGSTMHSGGPMWVDTGTEQLVIPLRSVEDVVNVRPDFSEFSAIAGERRRHAYTFGFSSDNQVVARFFFDVQGSLREDPATGSACANLGGWWLATGGAKPWQCEVRQGEHLQRPSTLILDVDAEAGISVSGDVQYLGAGELRLS